MEKDKNIYEDMSMVDVALKILEETKKPDTIVNIAAEVFKRKGIEKVDPQDYIQFEIDFMLSGNFICCAEDLEGTRLWDLKYRQNSKLLNQDKTYIDVVDEVFSEDALKYEMQEELLAQYEDEVLEEEDEEGDDEVIYDDISDEIDEDDEEEEDEDYDEYEDLDDEDYDEDEDDEFEDLI